MTDAGAEPLGADDLDETRDLTMPAGLWGCIDSIAEANGISWEMAMLGLLKVGIDNSPDAPEGNA